MPSSDAASRATSMTGELTRRVTLRYFSTPLLRATARSRAFVLFWAFRGGNVNVGEGQHDTFVRSLALGLDPEDALEGREHEGLEVDRPVLSEGMDEHEFVSLRDVVLQLELRRELRIVLDEPDEVGQADRLPSEEHVFGRLDGSLLPT